MNYLIYDRKAFLFRGSCARYTQFSIDFIDQILQNPFTVCFSPLPLLIWGQFRAF